MDLTKSIEMVSAPHTGMARAHNEDSIGTEAAIGPAVRADGMGGYNAGEVASGSPVALITKETRETVMRIPPYEIDADTGEPTATKILRNVIGKANGAIYQAANSQPQYAGMGTTLVVALLCDNHLTVAHIGDSRLSRLRNGRLRQL